MKAAAKSKPPEDTVEFIDDVEQLSEEWFALRRGIPTASKFGAIMASGKDGGAESLTREKYLRVLAGEVLTGQVAETFRNEAMDRGREMEPEAREWYARTRFVDLRRVGFVRRTVRCPLGEDFVVGCSPDSLVERAGDGPSKVPRRVLEIKTMRPDLLIPVAQRGAAGMPEGFRAQCQGSLWITGYEIADLVVYYRGWRSPPLFSLSRDEPYIARLKDEVERFAYELRQLVKDVKARGRGW